MQVSVEWAAGQTPGGTSARPQLEPQQLSVWAPWADCSPQTAPSMGGVLTAMLQGAGPQALSKVLIRVRIIKPLWKARPSTNIY